MSKISDELRKFINTYHLNSLQVYELNHIADRIDAEMVELPRDANDEPILPGDTVWGCISGTQMVIHELRLEGRWTISTDTGFAPKASAVTHVRPDGFERIADELDEMVDAADSADDRCEKLADLAKRIRKLAKRED